MTRTKLETRPGTGPPPPPERTDTPDALPSAPPPRSLLRRLLGQTLSRWGARVGLVWIAALVICAVFAPFIASSHPLLMRTTDGAWSSPALQHLTAADVILLVMFFAALIVLPLTGLRLGLRALILLGVLVVTAPPAFLLVEPPRPIVFERYRDMAAAGEVEFALRPPVSYSPRDRLRDQPQHRLVAPWWGAPARPTQPDHDHWLGTDSNGADIASNMIHASRIALAVGFIATGIAFTIGILIGGLMGYFSGIVDLIGMRLVEIFEFIPTLFLLLMFVAFFDRNIYMIMAIIGLTTWTGYARFLRAEFLRLRRQDFVQAAVACGLPLRSVLFRHMLPNGITPLLVVASFGVAGAILFEATLSFLGLGLVDEASWGALLNQATGASGAFSWWIAIFPGAAIFLTVFAYTLIGEALRDAIDPHLKKTAHL